MEMGRTLMGVALRRTEYWACVWTTPLSPTPSLSWEKRACALSVFWVKGAGILCNLLFLSPCRFTFLFDFHKKSLIFGGIRWFYRRIPVPADFISRWRLQKAEDVVFRMNGSELKRVKEFNLLGKDLDWESWQLCEYRLKNPEKQGGNGWGLREY